MAIFGLLFFFIGNIDPSYTEGSQFICGENGESIIMCPLCAEECTSWHLADICFATKLNRMFDNVFTVIFSLIMNLWGI
jgi:hypothetical protein